MKVSVDLSSPASPTTRHSPMRWPEDPVRLARYRAPLAANRAILALFAEADDALLTRCRKWSKGRRAWRARSEVRGVERRAPSSRRVQRKAVLRTPEPIQNDPFQSRHCPRVCWLVDQITHLVRILAVVVQAPAPGVGGRVGEPIGPDAAKQRGLLAALATRFRPLYMHQEGAFGGSHRISAHG